MTFRSHLDGSPQRLTPESAMEIQAALGSDIAMAFDECPPSDADPGVLVEAMERTTRWARRCLDAAAAPGSCASASCRAAPSLALRAATWPRSRRCRSTAWRSGGLAVGEPPEVMHAVVGHVAPLMPADRPRYLMGVGRPQDLLAGIAAGHRHVRLRDADAQRAQRAALRSGGHLNIANARHRDDRSPLDERAACEACRRYSRGYLSHLFRAKELLYYRLATLHNLQYYLNLVARRAQAIIEGRLATYAADRLARMAPDEG